MRLFLALPRGGGNKTICGASTPASRRDNETSEEAGRALISLVCTEIRSFNELPGLWRGVSGTVCTLSVAWSRFNVVQ